jgi:hypothetical protein
LHKLRVKQSIFINLPREEIFAYLSALENYVNWSGVTTAIRSVSSESIQVGTSVNSTLHFLGRSFDITFEIVEYEPCRYLTIKSISGVSPCLFCYQLEPVEDGMTRLSCEAQVSIIEGVLEHRESFLASIARRQLGFDLQTLKDILEDRALIREGAE